MGEPRDVGEVRRLVMEGLRDLPARVYLFSSWARGQGRRTSDIDVAIWPREPLPPGRILELQEALEQSDVVYPVDLVDLSEASPRLRERVLAEGVPWSA